MKRFVQEQLGKFLLVVALVWVGATYTFFPSRPTVFPDEAQFADYQKRVSVEYAPGELAPAEVFFPAGKADDYENEKLETWVHKKTPDIVFTGVELPEVTRARLQHAPQLLPDPGPSLKGADQLKRWGEELPPLNLPTPANKGKTGVKGRL
jgi:hypothetical protein